MTDAQDTDQGSLRSSFLLEDDVTFLNHGSFGATPRTVLDIYQQYQRRLERQPVRFLQRELPKLLADSRASLAEFVGCRSDELVFVRNPTFAANTLARCLPLGPGDELLTTNHEYGACRFAFRCMSQQRGFRIVEHDIPLPPPTNVEIVDQFWQRVNKKTKAIFLSHISSPTALRLPIDAICQRARNAGITTFVDGAHAPGQIELDLAAVGADFYTGACHKWLCAPKGASFLYARRNQQHLVHPLIVGWGWGDERTIKVGSDFLDGHQWLGTTDPSAYLSVPAAIEFQRQHDWPSVRQRCRLLARTAVQRAATVTGMPPAVPPEFHLQMGLIELPPDTDLPQLKNRLYDNHRVEIPVVAWQDRKFLRISVQAYNSSRDVETFVKALTEELGMA